VSELPVIHVDRPLTDEDLPFVGDRATIVGPGDDALGGAAATVIGVGHYWDADRFAQFPNLRVVARMGIGYDNIDIAAAREAGVVVCNAPDAPTVSTAEHTIALMMAVTKNLRGLSTRADEGRSGMALPTSLELDGATLGLVGLGRIGARVAVAAQALGMAVIASDPLLATSPVAGVELVDLDQIWERSDVISLHAPAIPETHHLIGDQTLPAMKHGVYLVNCARGSLVDQDALVVALDSGGVAAAGLDVTEPEPLPVGHPLLGREDVIVTPHVASSTRAGRRRLFEHAFDNALAALRGEPASVVS
jgi:phosphoglycerate dehydrogenase-like enzyme